MADLPPTHRRVLAALPSLGHDRPEVLASFAAATLRRVPTAQLLDADARAVAQRLADAFGLVDDRRGDDVLIRVRRPASGLDGRPAITTLVEVATEDRPFLLSTIVDELDRTGHRVVRTLHPIVGVRRGADGRIAEIVPARTAADRESLLHIELDGRLDPATDDDLVARLRGLVADVVSVTEDHDAMRARVRRLADELRADDAPDVDGDQAAEVAALLDWLLEDNLVLLGVRDYDLREDAGRRTVTVVAGSGLGLLSDTGRSRFADTIDVDDLPPGLRARVLDPPLLTVTRTNARSTVQRRVRMEYFGVVQRDDTGAPRREVRVLGLFTRKGYSEPARTTPVLRERLRTVLEREDLVPGSHDEVTLTSLFQALPKDELFQADVDELHRTLVGLLSAEEHREVRSLVRVDHWSRTVSILVAVPRDRYGPHLRERIEQELATRFGTGRIDVEVALGDRHEALVRFLLHVDGTIPDEATVDLQTRIRVLARSWPDALAERLAERLGHVEARRLETSVGARLPLSYRETVDVDEAVADVKLLDAVLRGPEPLLVALRRTDDEVVRLLAAKAGQPLELSGFLPILESLGLTVVEEVPHRLDGDGPPAHLHDFGVRAPDLGLGTDGPRLADAVLAAWRGHLEVDALNQLVVVAGLDWRDVAILRAFRRLRRQLGTAYTPEYVNETFVAHPGVVRALVEYVHARFDPLAEQSDVRLAAAREHVLAELDTLSRLDHDRILRSFLELVDATLRTNAFRPDAVADDTGEPYIAIKIDPSRVANVPAPVPHREIFVHSPRVEGVHLRAGRVARGGLRWSDRRDDVRAEVLDLLKAQTLKNAVIVPTGAKGGFVVRQEPDDPEELREEVKRQYMTFVRGLLDVTDDLDGDAVVGPPDVVRHDGDDPYLVVAADRGTATFSDTANALARRYGFWLDDAFASGGSNGYDHKALGVTARGAWLAVERHFRELGIDVATEPTTAVGVGDMSGDVFGNAFLQSRAVRLVAAFDHRDVFLDPDPDPERAFAERQRLFDLPRSSWQGYDRSMISAGGGVWPRTARSVPLSEEVRRVLRVEADELSPPELIQAILRAPVDLLFAGGIGTYVKASTEHHAATGDRANDELRVDANEVRARIIGEGANLFITQRARIEYARRGGHCNQDAIDNAAGVSTSDREVNVKILLTLARQDGLLADDERDHLLAALTDEVVALVMRDVDLQTAAISREVERSVERLLEYDTLLRRLEAVHGLDRQIEVLPDDDDLQARVDAGAGLTRPEIATVLAWAKRDLKDALLASPAIRSPLLEAVLADAFPRTLVERFGSLLPRHRLRDELIATVAANDVVDRMGVTFADALALDTGRSLADVVLAFRVARTALHADHWWEQLELHERTQGPERTRDLEQGVHRLLVAVTASLLTDRRWGDPATALERVRKVADELVDGMLHLGTPQQRRARMAHARWLVDDLVDVGLARFVACATDLPMIPDVASVLDLVGNGRTADDVADAFLRLGDALGVDRLEAALARTTPAGVWPRRQHRGLVAELRRCRRDAAVVTLRPRDDTDDRAAVDRFVAARRQALRRAMRLVDEAEQVEADRLDAIAVAVRAVRDLIDAPDPT